MTAQDEMRSEFEKLEEIADKLEYLFFEDGFYFRKYDDADSDEYFVNGAWYAFQEQQKILVDFINQNKFEPVETWIVGDVINVDRLLELLK